MRYTENRYGKMIIPEKHIEEAAKKLARYEDAEEYEEINPLISQFRKAADAEKANNPAVASLLGMAADMIVEINMWDNAQAAALLDKSARRKEEIFSFLDEIDGDITIDDPVRVIREKLEEILS